MVTQECYPEYKEVRAGEYISAERIAEEQHVIAIECAPREPSYCQYFVTVFAFGKRFNCPSVCPWTLTNRYSRFVTFAFAMTDIA